MPVASAVYLTPPEVAQRFHVDPHRVVAWIKTGELRAINIGDGTKRPRFRVSPSDLAAFEAARAAGPAPKISRIGRRAPAGVTEFF